MIRYIFACIASILSSCGYFEQTPTHCESMDELSRLERCAKGGEAYTHVGKGRVIYTFYAKQLLFFAGMMVSWFLSILKNDAASPCLSAFLTTLKNPKMGLHAKNGKCKQR